MTDDDMNMCAPGTSEYAEMDRKIKQSRARRENMEKIQMERFENNPIVKLVSRVVAYIVVAAILVLASSGLIMAIKLLWRVLWGQ
jgi:hypothetical protein